MSEYWLKCQVEKGMFSDENVVIIATADGSERSFFVPRSSVQGDRVRSEIIQQKEDVLVLALPTEALSMVAVKQEKMAV